MAYDSDNKSAAELQREVEQVVVGQPRAVLDLERLGGQVPHPGGDAAGDQQRDDVVVGRLAHLVVAARAAEGVVRQGGVAADHQGHVRGGELDLTAAGAGRLDRGHGPYS